MLSKIYYLFDKKRLSLLIIIFIFSIIAMLLETIGIGLLIPLVMIVSDNNFIQNYSEIVDYFPFILEMNRNQIITVASLFFISFYIIKIFFVGLLNYLNAYFVQTQQVYLSDRLLKHYLSLPYSFHLKTNSSSLIRNVVSEVGYFVAILSSLLYLTADILIAVGLSIFLLIYDFKTAIIIIFIFSIGGYLFDFLFKSKLKYWGENRLIHTEKLFKALQESLGGIREIIIYGKYNEFLNFFKYHNYNHSIIKKLVAFTSNLPRLWYEILGISILMTILLLNLGNKSISDITTLLIIFSAASLRLMPIFNRIVISFQNLRTFKPSIDILFNELTKNLIVKNDFNNSGEILLRNSLKIKNVFFQYDLKEKLTLDNVNLEIKKNEIIGIFGKSGSGKTTLLDIIIGILKPSKGMVLIDDIDIHKNPRSYQKIIGYVSQNIFLIDDTLEKNIAFGLKDKEIDNLKLKEAIKNSALNNYIDNLKYGIKTTVGEKGTRISGGQRQRVGIARALYFSPSILILDEATNALDEKTEDEILQTIKDLKGKITVIIVSHKSSSLKFCDKIIKLDNGKIISD